MRKYFVSGLLLFALLASLLPYTAYAAPASGEWVLESIDDQIPEDNKGEYDYYDDNMYQRRYSYDNTYARGSFTVAWRSRWQEFDNETITIKDYEVGSGTVSAVFDAPPERIQPGKIITVTGILSANATTVYPTPSVIAPAYGYWASIEASYGVQNLASPDQAVATVTEAVFKTGFSQPLKFSFSLDAPEESSDNLPARISVQMWLNCQNGDVMSTRYNYRFIPAAAATPSAATPTSIELGGLVLSVEKKPMRWMKLQAWLFYDTQTYKAGTQPDLIVDGMTDHNGRYQLKIPLQEGNTKPVGIMLTGTLDCLYPFEKGKKAFYFVDMADSFSSSNNYTSLCTWLTVKPADYAGLVKPDEPIQINRLLAFYNLGLGAWSFNDQLMPDPVYYFTTGDQVQALQDLSYLYTAAYDAWFFGAVTLKEEQALLAKPIRIETRMTPSATFETSCYTANDVTIHLMTEHTKRDDKSRFTILHEFGHAFDNLTLGNGSLRASKGYLPGDINHGGYLNGSTADSYLEGFATCYAALTQLYSGYPNPGALDNFALKTPSMFYAWGNLDGSGEEFAIASFLYYMHGVVGDTAAYWALLKPDRDNFKLYYDAFQKAVPADSALKLEEYAYSAGLYKMGYSDGRYNKGEPFRDSVGADGKKNGVYDEDELYADLSFAVDPKTNSIDISKPLKEQTWEQLKIGSVGGAGLPRSTIKEPLDCNLALKGTLPEYLLVDISSDSGTTRMLRAVNSAAVSLGLPYNRSEGTVKVSVPGGGVIYTGDLATLQAARDGHPGLPVALDTAQISKGNLAPAGTLVVATYGDISASGVMKTPVLSNDDLAAAAQGYDLTATLDEITVVNNPADAPDNDADDGSDIISTPEPDMDYGIGTSSSLGSILIIAGILVIIILAVVLLIVILASRRKKQRLYVPTNPAPPIIPSSRCLGCGAPYAPGSNCCSNCGRPLPTGNICTACNARLNPGARFCTVCGQPKQR